MAMTNVENIDWAATKKNFDVLYKQSAVARFLSISDSLVCLMLAGTYPHMSSVGAKRFIQWLSAMNLLVLKDQKAA